MAAKRTRRTAEQRIADLKAEIQRIKERASLQKIKKDPSLRHISAALRSIDKALSETKDPATKRGLQEARTGLAACMALHGAPTGTGSSQRASRPDSDKVLDYIRQNPGARSGDICNELETNPASLRPVLHQLRDDGAIVVDGKARAMSYSVRK